MRRSAGSIVRAASFALFAACYAPGHASAIDAGQADADSRGTVDAPGVVCAHYLQVDACTQAGDTHVVMLTQDSIDTSSASPDCLAGVAAVCEITGDEITIEPSAQTPTVVARGERPLVIVARSSITIAGPSTLDVSSTIMSAGPGASLDNCPSVALPANTAGLAGGSFGTSGGAGGSAGSSAGGEPILPASPQTLVAGCSGQTRDTSGSLGGGAVYLVAGVTIAVAGRIAADGAGGRGSIAGGNGGGAGGLVALEAPTITGTQNIEVFGGGGGAGGDGDVPTAGLDGADGNATSNHSLGGTAVVGGDGGDGDTGSGAMPGQTTNNTMEGAGGGGGGLGVIACSQPDLVNCASL